MIQLLEDFQVKKNSSFLLTPNKISRNFSVEATLKVTNCTINGEIQELADLHETNNGPMYLGFVICSANAEVDKFIIKRNENVIYGLSKKSLPRPILTAKAKGDNVDINWTGIQGSQNYIVQYREMGTSSWTTDPDKIMGKSHTVTNLTEMKAYEFRVEASAGESNGLTFALAIAVPGFRCSSIVSPLITGAVLSEDGKEVKVSYNNVMGDLGTLKLDVE
ncbi:fibronectin type III domain-containing protein [Clostridium estertheticum]|uniref:fibronectin type III domain-containing protein n=1 Tax=Clostridium estertheticum TaxID=238834 RepID=UPI001CF2BFD3|nr:fibronectin type III domain-containing protein [Clostridium estertheticum]MCB2309456.1 fibronectin type III domain-containing protein [Clostridium estertheticum]MCB2347897.1 fibronectin type III domain-containing protein [Clostridium estertheticum]MCB2352408.1 fibronectin type III domain-containing protein [Clostridium estertheticum]WAG46937.1 fibronectin type III domain-containing protein [Clostridium estertheticum]